MSYLPLPAAGEYRPVTAGAEDEAIAGGTGWRVFALGRDALGPALLPPQRGIGEGWSRVPDRPAGHDGPLLAAACSWCAQPPGPGCRCGLYFGWLIWSPGVTVLAAALTTPRERVWAAVEPIPPVLTDPQVRARYWAGSWRAAGLRLRELWVHARVPQAIVAALASRYQVPVGRWAGHAATASTRANLRSGSGH